MFVNLYEKAQKVVDLMLYMAMSALKMMDQQSMVHRTRNAYMPELPYYLKKGMPKDGPQQQEVAERWTFEVDQCWHRAHTSMKEPLKYYGSKSGAICLRQLCGSRWLKEPQSGYWVELKRKRFSKKKRSAPNAGLRSSIQIALSEY